MKKLIALIVLLFSSQFCFAEMLLSDQDIRAFSEEISGELAKRNLEFISRQHRMRGSKGYLAAAQFIEQELRKYGLSAVRIEEFPADGKIFYGTQKSRPPWNAEFAELWELNKDKTALRLIASWDAIPLTLAQDSEKADVKAELIDVGKGTSESDYQGKDVRNKIVLISEQPESAASLAVEQHGAAGIISYVQNQRTAWWGENENLIRWGHLDTFAKAPTFAFMVSLKEARAFQKRLAAGENILLHATVRAGKHSGNYQVLTGVIPGADPNLKQKEIVFSCHLDHPRPGANDNASGCVAILEVARVFSKLIAEHKIQPPARTLRFVWPAEVEGTLALLNGRPELPPRIISTIHMDMVGGSTETQAVFHITRGPASLPSFIYDIADSIGEFVNEQTDEFASTGSAKFPLHSVEGEKKALQAALAPFSMGSDHEIYTDSSFNVPAIYFNDWPDRYIHTNFDTPANIDPTKLKRAAFMGAANAYFLSNLTEKDLPKLSTMIQSAALKRTAAALNQTKDKQNAIEFELWYERAVFESLQRYVAVPDEMNRQFSDFLSKLSNIAGSKSNSNNTGDSTIVYMRKADLKGPMEVFGYSYLEDHYGKEKLKNIRLRDYQGERTDGSIYAYEALNLVDGKRSVQEITKLLSGAYGTVPLELIAEYLQALESIGVVLRKQ
ncbi:MAG TPA: M28 family metallopeptidase [Acidobacteriota bacterium]|nr:M28 family metallopeptidase [Acidobacteriota bacterium]